MQILPIGSGKGGVGKTMLAANLGILLSRLNQRVTLLDADLGASNLHTALGVPYLKKTLNDLLTGNASHLSQLAEETPIPELSLIGGSRVLPAYPDYKIQLSRKIQGGIADLDTDILIIDLGAGISPEALDLFLLSDHGIVVATNDPSSIQNAYQFLKMAVFRKILQAFPNNSLISYMIHAATHRRTRDTVCSIPDLLERIYRVDHYYEEVITRLMERFSPRIIVNMVDRVDDERAAHVVASVSQKFAGVSPKLLGTLEYSAGIKDATLRLRPFTLDPSNGKATEQLSLIAHRIFEQEIAPQGVQPAIEESAVLEDAPRRQRKEVWCMDNIEYENYPLHILTEKLSQSGMIQTSVYSAGKILFAKKMVYPELAETEDNGESLEKAVRKQHLTAIKGIQSGRLSFNP